MNLTNLRVRKGILYLFTLAGLLAGCGGGGSTAAVTPPPQEDPFPILSGYGTWMNIEGLGDVWHPNVMSDWAPYTNGQWEWTDQGWMWVTDEPFGWVVYHYGNWTRWGATGWVWVPGYEWSPARVVWYTADDYTCWAPAPPPRVSFPQFYDPGYENVWVAVPASQFTRTKVGQFRSLPPSIRPGTPRENERARPPDVSVVRRLVREPVRQMTIDRENVRSGQRTLTRVKLRDEATRPPVPAPRPVGPVTTQPQPMVPVAPQPAPLSPPPRRVVTPVPDNRVAPETGGREARPSIGPTTPLPAKRDAETSKPVLPPPPPPRVVTPKPPEAKPDDKPKVEEKKTPPPVQAPPNKDEQ